jgi:hypothetical protein
LIALFSTLGFECECLFLPVDVELDDPSCNINRGSSSTQEWPPKNKRCLMTDIHLEYLEVHGYERIPDSHRDTIPNSYWMSHRFIHQLHGSMDQGIMIQLIVDYLCHDAHTCFEITESLIKLLGANQKRDGWNTWVTILSRRPSRIASLHLSANTSLSVSGIGRF